MILQRHYRTLFLAIAIATLIVVGVGGWYLLRPPAALPPKIDLTNADPDVSQAVQAALTEVENDPRNAATWGKLGMVLRAHDFEAPCVEAFREAERLDPKEARWPYLQGLTLLLSQPNDGIACLRRAVDRGSSNSSSVRLRLAEALLASGEMDEAESHAQKIGASDPRAALVLARVAAARGDWIGSLKLLDRHRDEPNCQKQLTILRGQALLRMKRESEGESELKRARELPEDPNWADPLVREVERLRVGPSAQMMKADELIDEGRMRDAINVLETAVRRSPRSPELRLKLGQTYQLAGEPSSSRNTLAELTRKNPDLIDGWFHLGVAQLKLGEWDDAAKSFDRVVAAKPDHGFAYYNLAIAMRKKGDRARAIWALERSLECRPDYTPAREMFRELQNMK